MSREKQIEEMEKVIADAFMADYNIGCDPCTGTVATALYLEGYRQQSEGEWEQQPRPYEDEIICTACGANFNIIDNCYCSSLSILGSSGFATCCLVLLIHSFNGVLHLQKIHAKECY